MARPASGAGLKSPALTSLAGQELRIVEWSTGRRVNAGNQRPLCGLPLTFC